MHVLATFGDRLLAKFVPRVEASALWVWQYTCVQAYCVLNGVQGNRQLWREYCHDGSGYCTDATMVACNC